MGFTNSLVRLAPRNQFPRFFKSVAPKLHHKNGVTPMALAGAMWKCTKPQYGTAVTPERTRASLKLHRKHGNGVIAHSKKAQFGPSVTATGKRSSHKTFSRKRTAKRTAKAKKSKRTKRSKKARRASKKSPKAATPYVTFIRHVRRGLPAPMGQQTATIRALYRATSNIPNMKQRVAITQRVLRASTKARRPAAPKRHRKVAKASKLKSKRRVNKKKSAIKKKPAKKAIFKKKSSGHKGRRNPYLKFYRAMVLTGEVPNHPKGARSRQVKKLWKQTGHLKTIDARIRLGEAILAGVVNPATFQQTGANKTTKANKKTKAVSAPKSSSASPKRKKSKASQKKRVKALPKKKTASAIAFTVPAHFSRHPFATTYSILTPYAAGSTSSIRMRNVANAWRKTSVENDNRSARQRIKAVAAAMKRR